MASRKEMRRKVRRPLETGVVLVLKATIPFLPRNAVLGISRLGARLGMLFPSRERTVGLKNIEAVFGNTKTSAEKRRILQDSFATMGQTMLDIFWFSRNPQKRILDHVEFLEGPLRDSFFEDKPVVCITAHMGNWEIMGQTCALMGADMASIAATLKNKAVDRMFIEQRQRTGQTIIPQKGALKTLIARFRKNGKAAFVLDQNTDESEGGIVVDFLGLPMPVSPAPAALAYRTGTEIMLGFCLPKPGGRYRIRITQSIVPPPFDKALDTDAVARELTQQIQNGISKEIREHPQYWLWSYKHWRQSPGKDFPAHYPEY
jgi:Kdo2-lipid IVA lauroyltransferase/acyltransferase